MVQNKISPPDELLHSYIFRKMRALGEGDYHGIIGTGGDWKRNINLGDRHKKLVCHAEGESELCLVTKNYYFDSFVFHIIHNPFCFLNLYKPTFLSTTEHSYLFFVKNAMFKIKYCKQCIKDSIEANGFGYFKNVWISSNVCDVHGTPLLVMPKQNYNKTIQSILEVLSGESLLCQAVVPFVRSTQVSESEHRRLFPFNISPCLLKSIRSKVRNLLRRHRAGEFREQLKLDALLKVINKRASFKNGLYKQTDKYNRYDDISTLKYFIESDLSEVIGFDLNMVETITVYDGVLGSKSCVEKLTVLSERNCYTCEYSKKVCAASPHIELFVSDVECRYQWFNPCDLAKQNARRKHSREQKSFKGFSYNEPTCTDELWLPKNAIYWSDISDAFY